MAKTVGTVNFNPEGVGGFVRSSLAADRAAAQIRTQRLLASVAVARSLGAGWTAQAPVATIANAK